MSTVHEVDLFTIGAGGAAYPAAFLLARAGLRVVMADTKGVMSGNCLAEGCVPSNSVREVAAHRAPSAEIFPLGASGGAPGGL